MAADHAFGRSVLASVWSSALGSEPTLAALQVAGAIAAGEGGYGRAQYRLLSIPDGAVVSTVSDSNNWGAVQSRDKPPCTPTSFLATDSSPRLKSQANPKGLYNHCYHRHPTPEDGARSFLKTLIGSRKGVRAVIDSGDASRVAGAMFDSQYYEGFSANPRDNIRAYASMISRNAAAIANALGEPLAVSASELPDQVGPSDSPWWQSGTSGAEQTTEGGGGSSWLLLVGGGLTLLALSKRAARR